MTMLTVASRLICVLVGCVLMAGCVLPGVAACPTGERSCGQVWVQVLGPPGVQDWVAPDDYVLEIGDTGWPLASEMGGGVVAVNTFEAVDVRLVRPRDCRIIAQFSAGAGTDWLVRLDDAGQPTLEERTGMGVALGPGIGEGELSGCP